MRQITMNDLPVGRSVDETLRLVQVGYACNPIIAPPDTSEDLLLDTLLHLLLPLPPQAFMYTDKHGEVCPAGWQPGADTIIPDPKVTS